MRHGCQDNKQSGATYSPAKSGMTFDALHDVAIADRRVALPPEPPIGTPDVIPETVTIPHGQEPENQCDPETKRICGVAFKIQQNGTTKQGRDKASYEPAAEANSLFLCVGRVHRVSTSAVKVSENASIRRPNV
jgi:hypothetical protein